MLPYKNRLTKKEDFQKIQKYGQTYFFDNVKVRIAANGLGLTRVGVIVGKAALAKAVERNRAKRQIRAAVQKQLENLGKNRDIAFILTKRIKNKLDAGKLLEKTIAIIKKK